MTEPTSRLSPEDLDLGLRSCLSGSIEMPHNPGYANHQSWNTSVDVKPAAVILVESAADVSKTFQFAAEHGYKVAVQATGHGAVALSNDVLLLNTSPLQLCVVDPDTMTAQIGAGVLARTLLDAAAPHGLSPIVGSAATVGVVGYLTGGGVGPFLATFGLSSDYIRSMDVVTAVGEVLHVSPDENEDLYWALRGGKSAGAVITSVKLRLVPLAEFYGGAIYFEGAAAADVLRVWSDWSATLPAHATTSIALTRLPQMPTVAAPLAGRLTIAVRYASVADPDTSEKDLGPIRNVAESILDDIDVKPYAAIGRVFNEPTDPMPLLQDQVLLDELSPDALAAILAAAGPASETPLRVVEIRRLGGALAQPPEHASAFSNRTAPYSLTAIGVAPPTARASVASALRSTLAAVTPWSSGATLINFVREGGPDRVASSYDQATLERLRRTVERHDPHGLLATTGQIPR